MIFCQECGYKSPDHKLDCSQAGGKGATPKNTYAERQVLDSGPKDTTSTAIIAAIVTTNLISAPDTSTDSSTSTGE